MSGEIRRTTRANNAMINQVMLEETARLDEVEIIEFLRVANDFHNDFPDVFPPAVPI